MNTHQISPNILFGSIQDNQSSTADLTGMQENYEKLNSKLEQLNQSARAFASGDKSHDGVEIGNMSFPSRDDLREWVTDNLEDRNFPFGIFLDVFSFLARIQITYNNLGDSMLKNLDLNDRIKLTNDKSTTLAGFINVIPPIFGRSSGISSFASTKTTFLPVLKEKEAWETKARDGGAKGVIEDQIPNVLFQMRDLISSRLEGKSQAIMLVTTCLSISHSFVIDLARFISDTSMDLERSGFPHKQSWLLVTKLVVRIFGTDLDKVRAFISGKMDTKNPKELATDFLCATLRTIGVMKAYQRHGIENHPAISAKYVRFLVSNSALGSVQKFQTQIADLDVRVTEALSTAKAAQATAGTVMNKAEEAKTLAKKK